MRVAAVVVVNITGGGGKKQWVVHCMYHSSLLLHPHNFGRRALWLCPVLVGVFSGTVYIRDKPPWHTMSRVQGRSCSICRSLRKCSCHRNTSM